MVPKMKNKIIITAMLIIILSITCCVCQIMLTNKLLSPSGLFYLKTEVNTSKEDLRKYLCIKIIVWDKQGNLIEQIQTDASSRMRFNIKWQEDESILLESSDIGNYIWLKDNENRWSKKQIAP